MSASTGLRFRVATADAERLRRLADADHITESAFIRRLLNIALSYLYGGAQLEPIPHRGRPRKDSHGPI